MTAHVVITSACALADPLEVLQARARARATFYAAGELSLHDAVDPLQHWAVASGLVGEVGQDVVQLVLVRAFARFR
jgi:hypothetical protein